MLYTTYEKITRFLQRNEKKKNLEQLSEEQIKGEVGVILADHASLAIANKKAQSLFFGSRIKASTENMQYSKDNKEDVYYMKYKGSQYPDTIYARIDRKMLIDYLKDITSEDVCIAMQNKSDQPIRIWGDIDDQDVCFCIVAKGYTDWEKLSKEIEPDEE